MSHDPFSKTMLCREFSKEMPFDANQKFHSQVHLISLFPQGMSKVPVLGSIGAMAVVSYSRVFRTS